MFSEILKLKPTIEPKDADNMERTLSARFGRLAKKFGGGLASALKGTAVIAAVSFLADRLLNPLKEVQEVLDRTLNKGDDLATFAKQFGTSAGSLARLQAFGKATGLEPEGVRLLLGKFQASVAQAAADPSKPSSVSAFVGKADTAEAFFEFIQSMQKLSPTQQNLVQQEVFGEKQILKASEFLSANFVALGMQLKGPSAEALTNAAEFIASQSDRRDLMQATRELNDLPKKAQLIAGANGRGGIVDVMDLRAQMELARENERLGRFDKLAGIQITLDKISDVIEKQFADKIGFIAPYVPQIGNALVDIATSLATSRTIRGVFGGSSKKDK